MLSRFSAYLPSPARAAQCIFVFLPIISLAVMCLAWLKYGLDLPYFDDWNGYRGWNIDSFNPSYLFQPGNDTMYPVGKVLDAIAQRTIAGNSVLYQLISMSGVLSGYLIVQWKLLNFALADRFFAACAFALTLFMLQPDSYWGLQNLAYHQAIPLLLTMVVVYLVMTAPQCSWRRALAILLLALISGLTYTSGAFAACVLGLTFAGMGVVLKRPSQFFRPAVALLIPGIVTSALQLWVVLVYQHGQVHTHTSWAFPNSMDFWMYGLGKIGRSLALPHGHPLASIMVAAAVVLVCAGLLIAASRIALADRQKADPLQNTLVIALSLTAVVMFYLAQVASGRARLGAPPDASNLDMFAFGFLRFHFFWVTVLWPWGLALGILLALRFASRERVRKWALALTGVIVVAALSLGAMNHASLFRNIAKTRQASGMECLQRQLMTSDTIDCPDLYPADLSRAYAFAVASGASFVRYAPPSLRALNASQALHIMDVDASTVLKPLNTTVISRTVNSFDLAAGDDVQVSFSTGQPARLKQCISLLVQARVTAAAPDTAELFYLPVGEPGFKGSNSVRIAYRDDRLLTFIVSARRGFADKLRLDPVGNSQPSRVSDLSVRCLISF